VTNRGGKGVKTISVTDKTGGLVGILDVKESEDLIITCKSGITIRTKVADIRELGRATQGVKLIRIDEKDEIAAITRIDVQDEDDILPEDVIADVVGEADTTIPQADASDEEETTNPS
jgi:DNA gyrase subunit A